MTGKYTPEVKDCSVFKEIALNTVNPLEIIIEAISNADDANANHIRISIDRDKKGHLLITIEDNGQGISTEDLKNIFIRYYRGENKNSADNGSGLGMAIAKEVIEGHNGKINIESDLGEGTKISIVINKNGNQL